MGRKKNPLSEWMDVNRLILISVIIFSSYGLLYPNNCL